MDLCIDTSAATAVALVEDGVIKARGHHDSTRHHAESVIPLIRQMLAESGIGELSEAGIDAVMVGTGPAPFTGLRAGLISARMIGRVLGVPVWGASSLDIIARGALDYLSPTNEVIAISDARRRELYWARYRADGPHSVTRVSAPTVGSATVLANERASSGAKIVYAPPLPVHSQGILQAMDFGPSAALEPAVLSRIIRTRIARGETDLLGTGPLYLRRPDIQGQPVQSL